MRLLSLVRLALRGLPVAAAAACALPAAATEPLPPTAHTVKDLHYGDTLFQFFQDRYFSAVTTLMVSQHFGRVEHHADEAEVLRGGMLLSYGLHREAGEIFAQLIERGAQPAVRDRAWFYLAKIRYQRGYTADAELALAKVENRLPPELQEDHALLRANLLMARADYAGAAAALQGLDAQSSATRYARFNLGVALIRAGEPARGIAVLDALGQAYAENEEFRSLRDRANVALGFGALSDQKPEAARTYLERVRLQGLQANKALLGFGWAAASMKQPKLALVPWQELAQRDLGDAAALEARIAVPYAYAELGAYRQALDGYNAAIAAFADETAKLDESIAAIRRGTLVDALLERNPGDEMGWFWRMNALPQMPHASHLTQLMAQHPFQEAFKNYRDLRFLAGNLAEWHDKLVVFDDMLATRRKAFAERLPQVVQRSGELSRLDLLRQQRDALAAEIARGEADADGRAFADDKQLALLARVAEAQAGSAGDSPELARARQHVRLAAGVLAWQLSQDFTGRLWSAKKQLQAIDEQIAQAQRSQTALAAAQRDEPQRFDAFGARIAALRPTLDTMIPRVAALTQEQQVALQGIAVTALLQQKQRLAGYETQARFAVAQLYDRANLTAQAPKESSDATAK